ncbi:MAG: response regulator [Rhodobacterales bacterium]|nr:response regulator [Rhodobacterales bacterium]
MARKSKLNFFLVDDDPDMVALMTDLLVKAGHTVTTTDSTAVALPRILDARPDCVMIDLMMPGMDGLELCRELRAKRDLQSAKFIVISAKPYEFDRKRAYDVGADGYITKPLNADTFIQQVQRVLEDRVELTFWGVRGTLPVPGPRSVRYGGNTSCVTLEFSKGQFFIFDAGTGIKALSDHLMRENRARMEAKIFISHPHWDHINALPFFVPLFVQGNEFEILGASHGDFTMREMISAQMEGVYFPIRLKQFGARVYFRDLQEEEFEIDGVTVRTKLLNHPGKCLGYRVEYKGRSICYVTDNELDLESSHFFNPFYFKRLTRFVEGADVLITDCTYTDAEYRNRIGWGHSCVSRVVDLAHQGKVKTLYLFHHDPDQDDAAIEEKLKAAQGELRRLKSSTKVEAPKERQTVKV